MTIQDNHPQRSSEKKEAPKEIAWRKKSTEEVGGSSAYVHGIPFTFKEFQRIYDWAAASSRQVQNSRNNNDVLQSQHELKCSQTLQLGMGASYYNYNYIYYMICFGGLGANIHLQATGLRRLTLMKLLLSISCHQPHRLAAYSTITRMTWWITDQLFRFKIVSINPP